MTDKETISDLESTVSELREALRDQRRAWTETEEELTAAEADYEQIEEKCNDLEAAAEDTDPLVQTLAQHLLGLEVFAHPCDCGRCHLCGARLALRELLSGHQSVCQLDRATTDTGGSVYV